jgi:hypothetical protein
MAIDAVHPQVEQLTCTVVLLTHPFAFLTYTVYELFVSPVNIFDDCHVVLLIEYSNPAPVGLVTVKVPRPPEHTTEATGVEGKTVVPSI